MNPCYRIDPATGQRVAIVERSQQMEQPTQSFPFLPVGRCDCGVRIFGYRRKRCPACAKKLKVKRSQRINDAKRTAIPIEQRIVDRPGREQLMQFVICGDMSMSEFSRRTGMTLHGARHMKKRLMAKVTTDDALL